MEQTANSSDHHSSLQKRHKKALVEIESYKLLVESVQDYAIFLLDPSGNVLTWNKGAQRTKGYKAPEIIGQHFSKFYVQRDIDARKPEHELRTAKKLGKIEDEDWRVRKDGSKFWANVIITALRSESGKLVGYAKVTRDLTERKQHEDDLRDANIQLRKQGQELMSLNESKDEFISLASHQLRTPATAIKQLLGMLLEGFRGTLPTGQLQLIQKAYDGNERQLSIVNSLLKVAQLDAGKIILHKELVDINALLAEIIEEQQEIIGGRGQLLRHKFAPQSLMVELDQKYFRMALENLIDNASKYTLADGTITVSATQRGDNVVIKVKDTGVGIARQDLDKLFQKFKRIPNDLSQKVSGTGLGLYWAKQIVGLHSGQIKVASTPHKGTTFTITLPIKGADNV